MEKQKHGRIPDKEAKQMLDEIFQEDKLIKADDEVDDSTDTNETGHCTGVCKKEMGPVGKKLCECVFNAENSARFSLRVMEAMRQLQEAEDTMIPISTAEDIVDYIQANYRDDGDLYAQVRTALKQVCSQGLVMELLENEYHLVGPDAISMNQATCAMERRDCSLSLPLKQPGHHRKSNVEKCGRKHECACEKSFDEESTPPRKRRKVSSDRFVKSRKHREENVNEVEAGEDAEEDASALTLTDEECACEEEPRTSSKDSTKVERKRNEDQNNGDSVVHEEDRRSRHAAEHPGYTARRGENNQERNSDNVNRGRPGANEEDEMISETVDDIYRAYQEQNPGRSRKDEKEVKAWIKQCQEECKRRRNWRNRET